MRRHDGDTECELTVAEAPNPQDAIQRRARVWNGNNSIVAKRKKKGNCFVNTLKVGQNGTNRQSDHDDGTHATDRRERMNPDYFIYGRNPSRRESGKSRAIYLHGTLWESLSLRQRWMRQSLFFAPSRLASRSGGNKYPGHSASLKCVISIIELMEDCMRAIVQLTELQLNIIRIACQLDWIIEKKKKDGCLLCRGLRPLQKTQPWWWR